MALNSNLKITTTEMHTGGEPLRIIESGYPELLGDTVLEKIKYARRNLDHLRKLIIFEPRGHYDMYGALLVEPDLPGADTGVVFLHNEGYSTMCGHGVIALGRYMVDRGLVKNITSPETQVNIQCPAGLVQAFVEYSDGKSGRVRFNSVPSFAYATDVQVDVPGFGEITLDIGYGGAFYALVPAAKVGLDVQKSSCKSLVDAADKIKTAVKSQIKIEHPESQDLSFLYGTIFTDGKDEFSEQPTANITVFADKEVDRSPCGSGVTAQIAVQFAKGLIKIGEVRTFESAVTASQFTGKPLNATKCGQFDAVVVQVSGKGHYTGSGTYTVEEDDPHKGGFLIH